jgi:2'-5' RNA ligase
MNSARARAIRTFLALWPDPAVRAALADRAAAAARNTGGRAPRTDALHLTLVFIGATAPDKVEPLAAMMDSILMPPFALQFDRSGWFRNTGVAWLGAKSPPEPLLELQHALARGATRLGFSLDVRPYVPHLTLARNAHRPPEPALGAPVDWPVDGFVLVESRLSPDGPKYSILHETSLSAGAVAESRAVDPHAAAPQAGAR